MSKAKCCCECHCHGGAGTVIQKVEIAVTNNGDPNRVAHAIAAELAKFARRKKPPQ